MYSEQLEKIRAYALTAKATIYNEDAMTALELAGVTACKVNQCVDAINALCDLVEEIQIDIALRYDPDGEGITI